MSDQQTWGHDERTGEYVVSLYKDGAFYADRSLSCGAAMFRSAVKQWERQGYIVKVRRQPKG